MNLGRIALALGVVLLMTAAAACGGGTSNSYKAAPGNPTAAATKASTTGSGSPTAGGGTQKALTITAKDFSFSADSAGVAKGDTIAITFKNAGAAPHTLTFYSDAAYTSAIAGGDTGSVSGGATKTLTVTAGTGLYYRCNIHPTKMEGVIAIK